MRLLFNQPPVLEIHVHLVLSSEPPTLDAYKEGDGWGRGQTKYGATAAQQVVGSCKIVEHSSVWSYLNTSREGQEGYRPGCHTASLPT